jgi:hypothetical protein
MFIRKIAALIWNCILYVYRIFVITFLSFQIGQLYLVCGCMTIRRCFLYQNDLRGTLTFDYLKNNYLTLKSKSHKGHYGTQHTTLWSCTHIPNIVDLSRNTKMLWPGQENTILKTIIQMLYRAIKVFWLLIHVFTYIQLCI